MKQITFKELKEICGCKTNNEFANMIALYLDDASELVNIRGYTECAKLYSSKSHNIYSKLKELGYYDNLD